MPTSTAVAASQTSTAPAAENTVDTTPAPAGPTGDQQPPKDEDEQPKGKLHKWWEWIASTFEDAKDKLKGMFGQGKDKGSSS
jgi:hypothetical protein